MSAFKYAELVYATAVVVIALAVVFALDYTRRRRLLDDAKVAQLGNMAASASPARRNVKAVLLVVAVALGGLALARPQMEGTKLWQSRGIDVVIALDVSKSMLAADVYPSRVERARVELDKILDQFAGDRVGLVAFAGESVYYPLTNDHEATRMLYRGLNPGDLPPGTNIAGAVDKAQKLLAPTAKPNDALGSRGRAIVLVTDGEDTEGEARAAVDAAAKAGIETYVVAVGTPEGARVPIYDPDGQRTGWKVDRNGADHRSQLKEASLRDIARAGGGDGHYFRIDGGLAPLAAALSKLKEGNLDERALSIPTEAFTWLLFPAYMLLVIEVCVSERRRAKARERARA